MKNYSPKRNEIAKICSSIHLRLLVLLEKNLHSVMSHKNVIGDMLKKMGKRSQLLRNGVVGTMPAMAL